MNFDEKAIMRLIEAFEHSRILVPNSTNSLEESDFEESVLLSSDDLEELFELIEAGKSLGDDDFSNILKGIENIITKNKGH